MPTPIPERLGKYQVTDVLGEGAMGVVYKGFDPGIQRPVAIKTIRKQLDDGSDFGQSIAARFRNEAQAAGRLLHPGIVAVYDYGEDGDVAYIAMEYVEGNNLSQYLANRVRFSDDDILSVMGQVLEALDHAHQQGVWHRDIKPANLIMTRAGRVKIADFGIARIESSGLTQASTMIGTPTHMAPEQFLGETIDRRVDIYATGVLLYQLLTGRPPFSGSTEQLMYKVVYDMPPAPSKAEGGEQRFHGYDSVVLRALAKDRNQRWATAADFRQALIEAVGTQAQATVSEATVLSVPARRAAARQSVPPAAGSSAVATQASELPAERSMATQWDAEVLGQVEQSLAKHVGPMAAVMVRRAARECADLGALYARLAEQVTHPAARSSFLAHASQATRLTGAGGPSASATSMAGPLQAASGTSAASRSTASGAAGVALTDAVRDKAEKLLAVHVGPIARILVKKAAAATADRAQFTTRLAESLGDEAQRRRFLADMEKL